MHVSFIIPATTAFKLEKIVNAFAREQGSFRNTYPVWNAFSKLRDIYTVELPTDWGSYSAESDYDSTTAEHGALSSFTRGQTSKTRTKSKCRSAILKVQIADRTLSLTQQ
jgi:hypothetical protein